MFWKISCIYLLFVGSLFSNAYSDNYGQPFYELPCLSYGGMCVQTSDCPEGKQSQFKGLCPQQQRYGVECCHSVPLSETTCRRRGGECMPKTSQCPERLTDTRATDCSRNEKCCVLV